MLKYEVSYGGVEKSLEDTIRLHANSSLYQQLLTTYFAPHLSNLRHLLFYPDNIPLHKTPAMLTWFEENRLELIDVPAYSHEFNTVVYVWSWLKNYMQKQQSKNKLELEPAFDNGCESIPRNSLFIILMFMIFIIFG